MKMKVEELIKKLSDCEQSSEVKLWSAYTDCETSDVRISPQDDGSVLIADFTT
jgi:hypothetical protein